VVESVYSAVRTDSLYKADYVWSLMPYSLSLFSTKIRFHILFAVPYIIFSDRTSLKSSWVSGGLIDVICSF